MKEVLNDLGSTYVATQSMGFVLFSAFCISYVVRKHPCLGTVIALDSIDVKKKYFLVRILFIHTYLQLKLI